MVARLDSHAVFKGKRIGVVIPAYNEERQIQQVINTMPEIVDSIIVVDDASKDATAAQVEALKTKFGGRLTLVRHEKNAGVGAATVTGHRTALEQRIDVSVVMDGDGQMDPAELELILEPVACEEADFAKGNRLFSGQAWKKIPHVRFIGNAVLSMMTKIASGYWHVADSQSGYTAISSRALQSLDLSRLHPRYAFQNSILIQLNIRRWRVRDVPIEPRYGIGEKSSMQILNVIPDISWHLFVGFLDRMFEKYVVRDFHPLVFFYFFGGLLFTAGLVLAVVQLVIHFTHNSVIIVTTPVLVGLMTSAIQLLLFAMWFDMDYNKALR
jgi:glycosyltransferase involved in cell wall biosynthesis